jgi:hypothetical protein
MAVGMMQWFPIAVGLDDATKPWTAVSGWVV